MCNGIKQLQKLDEIVSSRNNIRDEYTKALEPLGFQVQKITNSVVYNVQSLVFVIPKNINRDDLVKYLKEQKIETTIGTYCLSGTTFYKNKYSNVQPNALYLENNTITFPCYSGLDLEYIISQIREYT